MNRQDFPRYRKYTKKRSRGARLGIIAGVFICVFLLAVASLFGYIYFKGNAILNVNQSKIKKKLPVTVQALPKEPLNILILGSDKRKNEQARSDTIILVRVFPREKKALMLSIPRDYRVRIPGYGKRKINSAYALDGPGLTIETIKELTGFPINHYLEMDFGGFVKVVDEFGGIDVNVEKELQEHRETFEISLQPGIHHLSGKKALNFVRFRHDSEGDFGRMKRQQQFAKALMEKAMSVGTLFKIPKLAEIAGNYTVTDLDMQSMVSLGFLLKSIPKENFITATLPGYPDMINGISFVVPDDDKLAQVLAAAQSPSVSRESLQKILAGTAMAEPEKEQRMVRQGVSMGVLNGSETSGMAREVSRSLRNLGFDMSYYKSADRSNYPKSLIIYSPGEHTKAVKVAKAFGYCDMVESRKQLDVDVRLIVGNDYALRVDNNG